MLRSRLIHAGALAGGLMASIGMITPSRADSPAPVPATRAELKRFLEDSKRNQPRLPLPALTPDEQARHDRGDWSVVNNARMRRAYLPPEIANANFLKPADPTITLDYPFQTRLFWVVSRCNNCTYCMGHQESKLAATGMADAAIGALDGDWSAFPASERAAFALARKLTLTPQSVSPGDIDGLRSFYNDAEITQILLFVANFNAMNRWTGALKIPQEEHRVYLSSTTLSDEIVSLVAPLDPNRPAGGMACAAPSRRPPLESPTQVAEALAVCRTRTATLPLADLATARTAAGNDATTTPDEWVRLLARFPRVGTARVALYRAGQTRGTLDPQLKAEIAYTAARHDRAWYALGHARRRLTALGFSTERIEALDGPLDQFTPAEAATLALARKLTVNPALVDDADLAALRSQMDDKQVAEVIHQIAEVAFFDRITESARLRLED